ncbi:MAG: mechanosensitive ion channel family protein [Halobacteriales archaeon]|nr:mechanosensitive ion channel family protein [Halobacteriales archaeon]
MELVREASKVVAAPDVGLEEVADFQPVITRATWFVAGFVVVLLVGWYVFEPFIARAVRRKNENNPTIQEAISRYTRLFFFIVAVAFGAGVAGYGGILGDSALVIAAATLAVGVAAQSVIGSIVSGLALVVDPEFSVGNYIRWSDGEGEVTSITLRVTRVETPDGALVTIPNTTLTNDAIFRPYGSSNYRVVEKIGVAYEDDVDAALRSLVESAEIIDGVMDDPAPKAYVEEFGGDAVMIRVHYHVEQPRELGVLGIRSRYARKAKKNLERSGITISPASKRELEGRIEVDGSTPE